MEVLIEKLNGVFKACVVGKPDKVSGELPMAFVEKKPNSSVTAEMVENLIRGLFYECLQCLKFYLMYENKYSQPAIFFSDNLSEYKQLRGGVIFLEKMPLTPSGKVNRKTIKLLAKNN